MQPAILQELSEASSFDRNRATSAPVTSAPRSHLTTPHVQPIYQRRNQHVMGRHAHAFKYQYMLHEPRSEPFTLLQHYVPGEPLKEYVFSSRSEHSFGTLAETLRTGTMELFNGLPPSIGQGRQLNILLFIDPLIPSAPLPPPSDLEMALRVRVYQRSIRDHMRDIELRWLARMRGNILRLPLANDMFVRSLLRWPEILGTQGGRAGYPGLRLFDHGPEGRGGILYREPRDPRTKGVNFGIFWCTQEGLATQTWLAVSAYLYQKLLFSVDEWQSRQCGWGIVSQDEYNAISSHIEIIERVVSLMGARGWESIIRITPFAGLDRIVMRQENQSAMISPNAVVSRGPDSFRRSYVSQTPPSTIYLDRY